MKRVILGLAMTTALAACDSAGGGRLMQDSALPFGAPEFSKYESGEYEAAFMAAFEQQKAEIDSIANITDAPTFDNTIGALEQSGKLLSKVSGIFFNLNETDADKVMKETEKKIMPLMTEHGAYMTMNEKLFERIKQVYDNKAQMNLTREQEMVLDKYYRKFVRGGGANY